MAKKKQIIDDTAVQTDVDTVEAVEPLAVSSRDALIALLDNMPQVPFLNAPTIDPQIVITDNYNPALREWKNKVRAIAENV